MKDYEVLFTNGKFLKLWSSQLLSQLTINIMNFIILAKLYTVTGSSIATSLLWVAYSLPAIFFGPIGAASVDIVSRRKTLMVTNLLQGLTVFSYIFLTHQSIFIVYLIVLAYSLLNQFYGPAETSYLPSAVKKEHLSHANSLFFLTQQVSLVLGFGFAGMIQRVLGFEGTIILCSVFLFIAFAATYFLKEIQPPTKMPETFEKILKTYFTSIIEGYRFIKNKKNILYPLLLLLCIQVGLAILAVSLPVVAVQILEISVFSVGVLVVVPAAIGATLGAIYIPRFLKHGKRKKVVIEFSMAMVAFCLLFTSLGVTHLPLYLKVFSSFISLMLGGFGFVGINIPALTYLQEATPEWLRGRVFGNLWFLVTIVTIFPVIFSGAITEIFGVKTMFTLIGVSILVFLIYSLKRGQIMIEDGFKKEKI